MNRVALSVVVPVYNVQEYLVECLESIVNQVEPFDEVILVNDGSTDNSRKICEAFCLKYTNLKLINQCNQGLSCARNAGIEHATGNYIIFVDSDDYVRTDMALTIKHKLLDTDLDVLYYSASMQFDIPQKRGGNFYIRKDELCNTVMSGQHFLKESFQINYIVSACLGVYKREFLMLKKISFPQGIYFEDNVFALRVFLNSKNILCISDPLYVRRIRNDSITTSKISIKKCEDIIKVQLLQWEILFSDRVVLQDIDLYRKFISFGIVQVIDMLSELKEDSTVLADEKAFIEAFFHYCYSIYADDMRDWCDTGILFFMLKLCRKYPKCIQDFFAGNEEYNNIHDKMEAKFYEYIRKMLEVIPFDQRDKKIAVYGVGNHTEKMIHFYQEICGTINCEIYFIVTARESNSTYLQKKIVSCDEIEDNTDFIVISSLIYQDEMINQLQRRNVQQEKIVTLYNNNEIYDLVLASKIENIRN